MSNNNEESERIPEAKVIKLKEIKIPKRTKEIASFEELSSEDKTHFLQDEIRKQKELLERLTKENEILLENGRKEIELERESWKTEKEVERKQAHEEGYAAGFAEGKQIANEKYAGKIAEANELTEQSIKEYHRTIEKYDHAIINLAIKVAEKITTKVIKDDPDHFTSIVKKAIAELKSSPTIEIILHPLNYQLVIEQKSELEEIIDEESNLLIRIDEELTAGDCIIKHALGQLDVGIDSQLEEIKLALAEKVMESN